MASTYSTNLAIELIGTGEQSGTWGTTTNTNLGTLLEQAISGYVTQAITDGADTTITIPNGATGVARNMAIEMTGALSATRNLIVPANKKLYFIFNNTSGGFAVTVKVTGLTGVSVPNGKKVILVSNGTDIVEAVNQVVGNLAVGGTLAVTGAGSFTTTLGVTGATTLQGITVGLGAGAISTNTAVGYEALFLNTSGAYNTAIGHQALYSNTTTNFNVAIGDRALYSNTTGTQNTGTGIQALFSNLTGIYNVADGAQALYNNTGSYNTGVGHSALSANTSGSGNTAISPNNSAGSYAPVFDPTTQSNRFCMGSTGVTNAYIQVAWTVVSDERDKTDFAPIPHGIDFVSKLKPTAYRYKMNREDTEGHGPIRYGFKAQDVLALEGIDPVIVDAEDAEKLRFNDQSMIAVLVNAIQELTAKVTALEAK